MADVQAEQQREMEGLLDNVRQLTRDLRLQMLIIDAFIPPEYQVQKIRMGKRIQKHCFNNSIAKVFENLFSFMIYYFVQAITEENVQWNEEIGEWQLKCVAYTGNNMRKVIE